jgi:hypothetical protein
VISEVRSEISSVRTAIGDVWNAIVNVANVTSDSQRAISRVRSIVRSVHDVIG